MLYRHVLDKISNKFRGPSTPRNIWTHSCFLALVLRVIYLINLTGQKRQVTELKWIWPVIVSEGSPEIISSLAFFGRNVVCVVVEPFFSLPLIFTLHWWLLAFLILSPLLQNFLVVLPTKKCLLGFFFISCPRSLSPFFLLSFAFLPPSLSFPLSFSCPIYQICGHDD